MDNQPWADFGSATASGGQTAYSEAVGLQPSLVGRLQQTSYAERYPFLKQ